MLIRMSRLFLSIFFLSFNLINSFNIDERDSARIVFDFNFTLNQVQNSYAGNSFVVTKTSEKASVIAGAPRFQTLSQQSSNGAIIQCEALLSVNASYSDWLSNTTCSVILSDDSLSVGVGQSKVNDLLGATFLVDRREPNDNQFLVCTPGRQKRCGGSGTFLPGACYIGPTTDDLRFLDGWGEAQCFGSFLDVVFLLDSSASISSSDFMAMREILVNVSSLFVDSISSSTQIGLLQYYHETEVVDDTSTDVFKYVRPARLGSCRDLSCLQTAIRDNMTFLNSPNTYTASAIREAVNVDFASSIYRDISRKILILITDGRTSPGDVANLFPSYYLTRDNDITVYAIGVGDQINEEHLQISANGGTSNERVFTTDNYSALSRQLFNLTREISRTSAEETGDELTSLENAQIGTSAHIVRQTGELFLGAVGAYYWSGTLIKYDTLNTPTADVLSFSTVRNIFSNYSENSYLGYAITSGYYEGGDDLYVAASAPRFNFTGAVLLQLSTQFDEINQSHVIEPFNPAESPFQHGSYFGASLLSVDVNDDGKDDLLIGAPLFTSNHCDEGRVFVYVTRSSGVFSINEWVLPTYTPQTLTGNEAIEGRFGTAIASIGDLNKDGYNDVIIGAPDSDEGHGAVYLFSGGGNGINTTPQQVISASSFGGPPIYSFGHSLHVGIDVDDNSYPDLFVGAPQSNVVVLLRSRPIVAINVTLDFNVSAIDVLSCFIHPIRNCLKLRACFAKKTSHVMEDAEISYNISVDLSLNRVEFRKDANVAATGISTISGNISLFSTQSTCVQHQLYVEREVRNFLTPVIAEVTYRLSNAHLNRPSSSVQQPNDVTKATARVVFNRGCDVNGTCSSNFNLTATFLRLPSASMLQNDNGETGMDGINRTLVVAADTANQTIKVGFNLSNLGAVAYWTRIIVTYPSLLEWKQMSDVGGSIPDDSTYCVFANQDESVEGGVNVRTLDYFNDQYMDNIFPAGSSCWFDLDLSFSSLRWSGEIGLLQITAQVFADGNRSLNSNDDVTIDIPVKYRADLSFRRNFPTTELAFTIGDSTHSVISIDEIGGVRNNAVFYYEIENLGFSRIPQSSISVTFPAVLTPTHYLLYLYEVVCSSIEGSASCVCDEATVNSLGLSLNRNETGSRVDVELNPEPLEDVLFICSEAQPPQYCRKLNCYVTNFDPLSVLRFRASFKLWTQSFRLAENISEVVLISKFVFSTKNSSFVIDVFGNQSRHEFENIIIARPVEDSASLNYTLLWFYAVGVAIGLLLLILVVLFLHKKGFFQRNHQNLPGNALYQWDTPQHKVDTWVVEDGGSNPTPDGEPDHDYDEVPADSNPSRISYVTKF